jgi:hypothetical protein
MSTAAAETGQLQDLTPSEVVLLRCDEFAPVPPVTLASRIRFEWNTAGAYLLGMLGATAVFAAADQTSHPVAFRIVTALIDLALPAIWWYQRRRMDPFFDREEIDVCRPLSGTRTAVVAELVQLAISTALLANESAGALRFENDGRNLIAAFGGSDLHWPLNSLEARLQRSGPIGVSQLVHDWMADGSNFPVVRALRIIEHCATLRGLAGPEPAGAGAAPADHGMAEAADPAPVKALLENCRQQRPAVWKALQAGIAKGVNSRTVRPGMEEVGDRRVPVFDYKEAPLSALDTPARPAAAPDPPSLP